MKKFISALSSFVIATTAMGGTFAISTDAATNTAVDSTVIAFRSNGESTVQAAAGDKVPVSLYIPQSSGFNTLALKMTINGAETMGKGSVKKLDGTVVNNYKYAFGNYGITASEGNFPRPCCLESGAISGAKKYAGYHKTGGMTYFTADAMNLQYIAKHAATREADKGGPCDMDSYAAWDAAGQPDYANYTPVTTWTEDEEWAYKYSFVDFDLNLPADLPDGTYVLDVYQDEYFVCTPSSLFLPDGTEKPDYAEGENDPHKTTGKSSASGVKGEQKLTSKPLTIVVGDPTPGTTTVSQTTTKVTTTTPGKTVNTDGKIIYNLIPAGKDYTAAADGSTGNNVVKAEAGEELTIHWTVKNDV
ncbi:MAG TPA: hypothetical protein DCG49_08660, partial [Ruminococcus sp.]|nr:hypothetical protein [Ruminococcus sp.]